MKTIDKIWNAMKVLLVIDFIVRFITGIILGYNRATKKFEEKKWEKAAHRVENIFDHKIDQKFAKKIDHMDEISFDDLRHACQE